GCRSAHNVLSPAAGPQAADIQWLYWFIFTICAIVFGLVMAAFARGAARSYVRKGPPVPPFENKEADHKAIVPVIIAIAVTVASLFAVLSLSVWKSGDYEAVGPNPTTIEVTGHQWWWELRYPNSEPDRIVTSAN